MYVTCLLFVSLYKINFSRLHTTDIAQVWSLWTQTFFWISKTLNSIIEILHNKITNSLLVLFLTCRWHGFCLIFILTDWKKTNITLWMGMHRVKFSNYLVFVGMFNSVVYYHRWVKLLGSSCLFALVKAYWCVVSRLI
jgi:hypothetical protein